MIQPPYFFFFVAVEHNFPENVTVQYLRMAQTAFCFVGLGEH